MLAVLERAMFVSWIPIVMYVQNICCSNDEANISCKDLHWFQDKDGLLSASDLVAAFAAHGKSIGSGEAQVQQAYSIYNIVYQLYTTMYIYQ